MTKTGHIVDPPAVQLNNSQAEAGSLAGIAGFFGRVDDSAVLVLSTLPGDLSLDRAVTITDFIDLASHFNAPAAAKLEAS